MKNIDIELLKTIDEKIKEQMKDIHIYTTEEKIESIIRNSINLEVRSKVETMTGKHFSSTVNVMLKNFTDDEIYKYIHSKTFIDDIRKSFLMWIKIEYGKLSDLY